MARRGRVLLLVLGAAVITGAAVVGVVVARDGDDAPGPQAPWAVEAGVPTESPVSPPPEDPEDVATDTAMPTTAAVEITHTGVDEAASAVVVRAYVAALVEEGGMCTLSLSRDGTTVTAESEALADARTTSCGQMAVPLSEVSPGGWDVVVTYDSPAGGSTAAGRTTVEVP